MTRIKLAWLRLCEAYWLTKYELALRSNQAAWNRYLDSGFNDTRSLDRACDDTLTARVALLKADACADRIEDITENLAN